MLICSYYTPDYAEHADRLRASLDRFGYHYWIEAVEDRGKWVHNCAAKAAFVRDAMIAAGEPVLWLDADAEIKRQVWGIESLYVEGSGQSDFAIYRDERAKHAKWKFRSGTVWFNQTKAAHRLCEDWTRRCEEAPDRLDQESLWLAWDGMGKAIDVRTHWLPMTYCQRFDEPDGVPDPHIVHYQASRETRKRRAGRFG